MNRRMLLSLIVITALIITGVTLLSYYGSLTTYTINYSHISNVKVIQTNGATSSEVGVVQKSGDAIHVSSDNSYSVQYTGDDGYASGTKKLSTAEKVVTIDPDFSQDHYETLVNDTLPAIRSAINERYPTAASIFTIDKGSMRDKGTWFVAWLVYRGEYNKNSDSLRILLKYENKQWVLKTQPDIILTSTNYPRVPVDVLSWANAAIF